MNSHKKLMNFQYAKQEMVNFDVQEIKPKQSFKSKTFVNSREVEHLNKSLNLRIPRILSVVNFRNLA